MKGYFLLREKELLYHSSTSKSLSLFPPWHCKQLLDLFPRVFDESLAYRSLSLKQSMQHQSENFGSIRDVCKAQYYVLESCIFSAGTGVRKIVL